jgi:hypothetical protein
MVWMRSSGMGKFKKLWGRVRENIEVGEYSLLIQNSNLILILIKHNLEIL